MLLWLFIIFLGIAFGAGLYESRVVASPDSGHRFWAFVTTGPLTLLTVANLVAALQTQGPARAWWLTAAIVMLVERAATFGYFIPTIIRLQRTPTLTQTAVRTALARWVRLNYVRNTLTLVAWFAALKVLAMS